MFASADSGATEPDIQSENFVNRNAEALFGYTQDELVGQPLEMLVPERVRQAHPQYVRDFLRRQRRVRWVRVASCMDVVKTARK